MANGASKVTLMLATDLVERMRNACFWREEPLAQVVTRALRVELRRMEHSNGKRYAQRNGDLPVGRPKLTAMLVLFAFLPLLAACTGWKENAMIIQGDRGAWQFEKDQYGQMRVVDAENVHYIVLESSTTGNFWSSQPGTTAIKHCRVHYTSVQQAAMREALGMHGFSGAYLTEYGNCDYQRKREVHLDQSVASILQGPMSAALLGLGLGLGLSHIPSDTYNQNAYGGNGGAGGSGYGGTANAYGGNSHIDIRGWRFGHH